MPSTTEIATWQQANPDVALWCQGSASEGHALHGRTWLSPAETNEVRSTYILSLCVLDPDAPAGIHEALLVPSGDWTVRFEGCSYDFRIWTVQRGPLAGQRIVKVRRPNGLYRGFAFITRTSGVRVWQRFERENNDPHVRAIRWAVNYAVEHYCDLRWLEDYRSGDINITINCLICNVRANDVSDAMLPLCREHSTARDNHRATSGIRRTRARRNETSELLLCENGTGLVR